MLVPSWFPDCCANWSSPPPSRACCGCLPRPTPTLPVRSPVW